MTAGFVLLGLGILNALSCVSQVVRLFYENVWVCHGFDCFPNALKSTDKHLPMSSSVSQQLAHLCVKQSVKFIHTDFDSTRLNFSIFLPDLLCDLNLALNHHVTLKVNVTKIAFPGMELNMFFKLDVVKMK